MIKKNTICAGAVMLSGCLWGLVGFFGRHMGNMGFDSMDMVFARYSLSAVLFAMTIAITDFRGFAFKFSDFWCFIGSGLLSLLFFSACYFKTIEFMSLSTAAILLYTAPCFVIILSSVIFKEKVSGRKILAMLIAFLGCSLCSGIAGIGESISSMGILFGLGSGLGYALYSIFVKLALDRGYSSSTINFYSSLLAAIGSGVIGGFRQPLLLMSADWGTLLFCIVSALLTTYLPYLIYAYGLTGIEPGRASIMASIEPVMATIVGITAFGEALTLWSAAGMALVLAAIVILNSGKESREDRQGGCASV